ncbi:hypothetical protein GCM10027299_51740 [Larkinella ripae]
MLIDLMMKSNPSADRGFDRIAPVYDGLARLVFGNAQRNAQTHWLPTLPPNSDFLIFGGGSGWLLARVLTVCQPRTVTYIDASPVMVALARQRVKNDQRVDFRIGTETAIRLNDQVDVIITPFVLDLFTDERLENRIVPDLLRALRPGGFWLCCDFTLPTRWWHRILLWSQYRFFRLISGIEARQLPNWYEILNSLSATTHRQTATFFGEMIASGYWEKSKSTG